MLGRFTSVRDAAYNEDLLISRSVVAIFEVEKIYNGSFESMVVLVSFSSDMLVYPRSDVSRYIKRMEYFDSVKKHIDNTKLETERIESSFANEIIDCSEYQDALVEIEGSRILITDRFLLMPTNLVYIIDGESFYEIGGN